MNGKFQFPAEILIQISVSVVYYCLYFVINFWARFFLPVQSVPCKDVINQLDVTGLVVNSATIVVHINLKMIVLNDGNNSKKLAHFWAWNIFKLTYLYFDQAFWNSCYHW